jgi:hypothetical protein
MLLRHSKRHNEIAICKRPVVILVLYREMSAYSLVLESLDNEPEY